MTPEEPSSWCYVVEWSLIVAATVFALAATTGPVDRLLSRLFRRGQGGKEAAMKALGRRRFWSRRAAQRKQEAARAAIG